jgi:hypothetical protein
MSVTTTTRRYTSHANHPGAWRAGDVNVDSLSFDLETSHIGALKDALAATKRRGLETTAITAADFPLGPLDEPVARLKREMLEGRGIVFIRGFPAGTLPLEDEEAIFWGVGAHFGKAVSQSVLGDRLGRVIDMTDVDPNARAYRARRELTLHTDLSDAIGFWCVRRAMTGGLSQYASALAVHERLLLEAPHHLDVLYRGFRWHRLGENGPDEAPITPHRVPVFSELDRQVSCRYVRTYMTEAAHHLGTPMTEAEVAALDAFDRIVNTPEFRLELMLEPGTVVFLNNLTVLHARTAFENYPPPAEKRLLLRLWLGVPGGRSTVPEILVYDTGPGGGIRYQPGRTPSFRKSTAARD